MFFFLIVCNGFNDDDITEQEDEWPLHLLTQETKERVIASSMNVILK